MNFLAHAYLSFDQPRVLAGNLISDFVKGKKKYVYQPTIQLGIALHRAIDQFTDTHEITALAKRFFAPDYRLYAGAFIDIVYDHFLANDTNAFPHEEALAGFSLKTYGQLQPLLEELPEQFQLIFRHMRREDWLFNYRYREGIYNSFRGLVRRAVYLQDERPARQVFDRHYDQLRILYQQFFPGLKAFASQRLSLLQEEEGAGPKQ